MACSDLLADGTEIRSVAATRYNNQSSRSHAVFTLRVDQKYTQAGEVNRVMDGTCLAAACWRLDQPSRGVHVLYAVLRR